MGVLLCATTTAMKIWTSQDVRTRRKNGTDLRQAKRLLPVVPHIVYGNFGYHALLDGFLGEGPFPRTRAQEVYYLHVCEAGCFASSRCVCG